MPYPSPWRAAGRMLGIGAAGGLAIMAFVRSESGQVLPGVPVALLLVALLGGAELQAALRLNWSLREFASQVPGTPEASTSLGGDQSIGWPDIGLEAKGGTHRFRVERLTVETGDRTRSASLRRPRESAREALERLGHEPAFEDFTERMPSVYPRLSAIRVGIPVTGAAFVLAAVVHPRLSAEVLLAGVVAIGVLAPGLRWVGLARVRRALVDLADGLRDGGVAVERIDLAGGIVAPAFRLRTDHGRVAVRCVAHPWGRLRTTVGEETFDGRLGDADAVGRDAASRLREGEPGEPVVDRDSVVTVGRLSMAAFGTLFTAFGALLVVRPGVVTAGECTRACLLEWLVAVVPFFNVLFGGTLALLGVVLLVLAAGRISALNR